MIGSTARPQPAATQPKGAHEDAARGGKTLAAIGVQDELRGTYLLRRVELKKARNGKDYLDLEIGDASGALPAKMWDATPDLYRTLTGVDFVEVTGKIEVFQERKQVKLTVLRPAEGRIDPRDFLPRSPFDPNERLARLRAIVATMASAPLRRLIASFLDDERFLARFLEAPAAVSNHHAYLGGLLEHIVSLAEACLTTCEAYPALDRDLLIAGAFFHDIGKVEELTVARAFEYSDRGRLIGHIVTGVLWIEERARAIPGFPPDTLDQLKHLVLSHHGELEWGSPVVPLTAEAIALHALDNLDAKLWAYERAVRDSGENGSSFTEWSKVFGRKLYKPPAARAGGRDAR